MSRRIHLLLAPSSTTTVLRETQLELIEAAPALGNPLENEQRFHRTRHESLREGLPTGPCPSPGSVVIFGASGDLTYRKLVPALYIIAADGDLPAALSAAGFARREKTTLPSNRARRSNAQVFQAGTQRGAVEKFSERILHQRSEFGDISGYTTRPALDQLDAQRNTQATGSLSSVAPSEFAGILEKPPPRV